MALCPKCEKQELEKDEKLCPHCNNKRANKWMKIGQGAVAVASVVIAIIMQKPPKIN